MWTLDLRCKYSCDKRCGCGETSLCLSGSQARKPTEHIIDGNKKSDPVCPRVPVVVLLFMETAETASSSAALLFPPSSRHGGDAVKREESQNVNKSYEPTHENVLRVTQQN